MYTNNAFSTILLQYVAAISQSFRTKLGLAAIPSDVCREDMITRTKPTNNRNRAWTCNYNWKEEKHLSFSTIFQQISWADETSNNTEKAKSPSTFSLILCYLILQVKHLRKKWKTEDYRKGKKAIRKKTQWWYPAIRIFVIIVTIKGWHTWICIVNGDKEHQNDQNPLHVWWNRWNTKTTPWIFSKWKRC